jgi:hypothetical protein
MSRSVASSTSSWKLARRSLQISTVVSLICVAGCSCPTGKAKQKPDASSATTGKAAGSKPTSRGKEAPPRETARAPKAAAKTTTPSGKTLTPREKKFAAAEERIKPEHATGPIISGMIWNGETLDPVKGARVKEYGVEGSDSQVTSMSGAFKLKLKNVATPAVWVQMAGFVNTIQIASKESRAVFQGKYVIEVFDNASEEKAKSDFLGGSPPDLRDGKVVLNFQPQGVPAGVSAKLGSKKGTAWISDAQDRLKRGNKLPMNPGIGEILYTGMEPGWHPVKVMTPAGISCAGPTKVPVIKGTYTRVYFLCKKTGGAK